MLAPCLQHNSYSILYTVDESTQDHIPESDIRPAPASSSKLELAATLGFPAGWEATQQKKRYVFTSPAGEIFRSKKAALDYLRDLTSEAEDPPWRTAGHVLMGRRVFYQQAHKLSGARSVMVEQVGNVVGWISKTDKDRHGEPGYVSEETGKPASLFHVVFSDQPGHAYPKHLIESMDMEEEEATRMLIEEGSQPPKKRTRVSRG